MYEGLIYYDVTPVSPSSLRLIPHTQLSDSAAGTVLTIALYSWNNRPRRPPTPPGNMISCQRSEFVFVRKPH